MNLGIDLAERGWLPDAALRWGIRKLLSARARQEQRLGCEGRQEALRKIIGELRSSPIAIQTDQANAQHYEVPSAYYQRALGPRLKYSSCYWPEGITTLKAAEIAMLELTAERAELADGQEILELGCGWGSLCLWMAEKYPGSRILAVSNSNTQREFIEGEAAKRGLSNLKIVTADMNVFTTERRFDRVVSVEMFEHMRNYEQLMLRIAGWLQPMGKLFVHIFAHRDSPYYFETGDGQDWMAKHFFTGGIMPSDELLPRFQQDLQLEDQWRVDGRHYAKTLEAWLVLHDRHRRELLPLFRETYGPTEGPRMFYRWRIFYIACAELFGYRDGDQWWVSHYRFVRRG